MEGEELLTKSELAKMVKLTTRTIDRKVAAGEIPNYIELGCRRRWLRSTILQWLSDGCPKSEVQTNAS